MFRKKNITKAYLFKETEQFTWAYIKLAYFKHSKLSKRTLFYGHNTAYNSEPLDLTLHFNCQIHPRTRELHHFKVFHSDGNNLQQR